MFFLLICLEATLYLSIAFTNASVSIISFLVRIKSDRPQSNGPQSSATASTKVSAVLKIETFSVAEYGSDFHCHFSRLSTTRCGKRTPIQFCTILTALFILRTNLSALLYFRMWTKWLQFDPLVGHVSSNWYHLAGFESITALRLFPTPWMFWQECPYSGLQHLFRHRKITLTRY